MVNNAIMLPGQRNNAPPGSIARVGSKTGSGSDGLQIFSMMQPKRCWRVVDAQTEGNIGGMSMRKILFATLAAAAVFAAAPAPARVYFCARPGGARVQGG